MHHHERTFGEREVCGLLERLEAEFVPQVLAPVLQGIVIPANERDGHARIDQVGEGGKNTDVSMHDEVAPASPPWASRSHSIAAHA